MGTGTAWGTQYRAIYVPVRIPSAVTVVELAYGCQSTATGNVDIGLYTASGSKLISTGSTAKSTSTAVISVDVTDTSITAGLYYLALNNDTTTDTFQALSDTAPTPAARGVLTETLGSVTLPATASWAVDNTLAFIPLIAAMQITEIA